MRKIPMDSRTKSYIVILMFLVVVLGLSQISYSAEVITRNKLWVHLDEAGLLAFDNPVGSGRLSYPGFWDSEPNYGWCWNTPILGYRMVRQDTIYANFINNWNFPAVSIITQELVVETNYNGLENSLGARVPEVVVSGAIITNKDYGTSSNLPKNVEVEFKTNSMAWSYPKYDDFLITEYTVINREVDSLYNFTFRFTFPLYAAGINAFENDVEYIYDENRNVFVFYDDRSYAVTNPDQPAQFLHGPGPETGDVGDPADITAANAINHQITCPSALAIGYIEIPPNELDKIAGRTDGTLQHLVTRWFTGQPASGMPQLENIGHPNIITIIPVEDLTSPVPYYRDEAVHALKSYRKAKEDGDAQAGNVWERWPVYTTSFGPYNMAPGDSITFKRIICAGALDFNEAAEGGVEATKKLDMNFVTEVEGGEGDHSEHAAIKDFRRNWDAALGLIETQRQTGYYTPTAVPPPTVGSPPQVGGGDELEAEPVFFQVGDITESGVELKWTPVPEDYVDPITGEDDFVGYIIYRSEISVTGSWKAIDTVLASEVTIDGDGRAVHRVQSQAGIPYRFGVTAFDSEGLECAFTAYTFFSVVAAFAPNDNFAKEVLVVPNPYKQASGFSDPGELKRITLLNIPSKCTVRIFNLARDLIQTIEHDDGTGSTSWGSSAEILDDYMLSRYRQNVAPGLYFWQITNNVPGHQGETAIGKFVIIK